MLILENYKNRQQVSRDEILDIMNDMEEMPGTSGKFISVTYASNVSTYLKQNKSIDFDGAKKHIEDNEEYQNQKWYNSLKDFNEGLIKDNPLSSVIAIKRYLFNWKTREEFAKEYDDWANRRNNIRNKYLKLDTDGVLGDNKNPTKKSDFGTQVNSNTNNLSLSVNTAKANIKVRNFFVDGDGDETTLTEVKKELIDFYKRKSSSGGYKVEKTALDQLVGEDLEAYTKAMQEIDKEMKINNLLFDKILCIAGYVNGKSFYYINDKVLLNKTTSKNSSMVNQSSLVKIAEEQLNESFEEIDNFAK